MSSQKTAPWVRKATFGGVALIGAAFVSATWVGPAEAIPPAQKSCTSETTSNNSRNYWIAVPNSAATVNNGSYSRYVVVHFNADAYVSKTPSTGAASSMKIGYRVDNGQIQEFARAFATEQASWLTSHNMAVLWVPAGTHVIRPYWLVGGGSVGKVGWLGARCLTAEAYTG